MTDRDTIASDVAALAEADPLLTLPFDQYQRYKLIAEIIQRLDPSGNALILDVGGWPGTLRQFLPAATIVLADISGRLPDMVYADGAALPFRDQQFDLVVSSDTFEHIVPERRPMFLLELQRTARQAVILGAPFDSPAVRQAEEILQTLIGEKFPQGYQFLEEHRLYGLPDIDETLASLHSRDWETVALPNGYLHRWLPMLALYFLLQWRSPYEPLFNRLNAFYNSHFFRRDIRAPGYRTTIVARPRGVKDLADAFADYGTADAPQDSPDADPWEGAMVLLKAIELEVSVSPREPMRRILELEAQLSEQSEWAQTSARAVVERDEIVRDLQAQIAERNEVIRDLQALISAQSARSLNGILKRLRDRVIRRH